MKNRLHSFDFCALSFERHGYLAEETVNFTKKLASCRANALGLEPSSEVRRWYGVLSCCIQRSNAKILRGGPVPARVLRQPPRFSSRGSVLTARNTLPIWFGASLVFCVIDPETSATPPHVPPPPGPRTWSMSAPLLRVWRRRQDA